MNDHDKQPSAPTRCSHDCATGRKKPVRSEATRHSHGRCPACLGDGWMQVIRGNRIYTNQCKLCKGSGRANEPS